MSGDSLAALELGWLYVLVTSGSPFHLPTEHCGGTEVVTLSQLQHHVGGRGDGCLRRPEHPYKECTRNPLAHYSTALSGSYQSAHPLTRWSVTLVITLVPPC